MPPVASFNPMTAPNIATAARLMNGFRQLVETFHKRHRRAVEILYFRVCGFDDVIFVGR